MKNLTLLILCSFFAFSSFAQDNDFTTESDPKATALLKKISEEYKALKSMEVNFSLTIEIPEADVEIQEGKMVQQGDKYRMEMGGREIISNGNKLWLYMEDRNEVQINDIDEDEDAESIMSPNDLFNMYEKGEYIYALSTEFTEAGKTVQQIEFKPVDKYSEYTKLRLTIEKKGSKVKRMKVFGKDGSRYTLTIDKLLKNKEFAETFFVFNKSEYPAGVRVNDLSMD